MHNQQDQLLVGTATAAAMAATEASKAIARFGHEGGRQFVLLPVGATEGPQTPVEHDDTRYAGMVEAASQPQRPASVAPATRMDERPLKK